MTRIRIGIRIVLAAVLVTLLLAAPAEAASVKGT
jgi:hypothetical protein